MLCYLTKLKTTQDFNQDILIDLFFKWIQTTKNKIPGLHFESLPFECKITDKHIMMRKLNSSLFAIYFATTHNRKQMCFIIEIFYSPDSQEIQLQFSKETEEKSGYIANISIPNIFKMIIHSPYIEKDILPITDVPHKIQDISHFTCQLPIIYVQTKLIDKTKLAQQLIGIAHICYEDNCIEKKIITVVYPDHHILNYHLDSNHPQFNIDLFLNDIRQYHIHHLTAYSFLQLLQQESQKEYQKIKADHQDILNLYNDEMSIYEQEIQDYTEIYQLLQNEYQKKFYENKELYKKIEQNKNDCLFNIQNYDEIDQYQKLIIHILKIYQRDLSSTSDIYRSLDIINSILENNGG